MDFSYQNLHHRNGKSKERQDIETNHYEIDYQKYSNSWHINYYWFNHLPIFDIFLVNQYSIFYLLFLTNIYKWIILIDYLQNWIVLSMGSYRAKAQLNFIEIDNDILSWILSKYNRILLFIVLGYLLTDNIYRYSSIAQFDHINILQF